MKLFTPPLFVAALLSTSGAALACDPLQVSADPYKLERGRQYLGTGVVSLNEGEAQGCYLLKQEATPAFLLRLISGPAIQTSEFCLQPDGHLRSYGYRQERSGVGADKENYSLTFDWQAQEVRGGRFEKAPLTPNLGDTLLTQIKVRRWLCALEWPEEGLPEQELELEYVNHRGPGVYRFAITRQETLEVPAGKFDTIVVSRVDDPNRRSEFWLDPAQDFRVLKAEQQKEDRPTVRLSLLPADPR